jgi:Domain of unknown function (DUF1877)
MSMLATYVQVEPELLDRIRRDTSIAEQLFMPELPGFGFDAEEMRTRILERGPQLVAATAELNPQLREMIEGAVGRTTEALQRGDGGDELLKLMQERLGPPPGGGRGALTGAHAELSLDKAWHGVHYLLSGSTEPTESPLGQCVLGGTEVGEDLGYGPARAFDPAQVARIAKALADPEAEREAADRFDAARMTDLQIYPFGWEEDDRAWLLVSFRELRGFYAAAAAQGWAAVTCLV